MDPDTEVAIAALGVAIRSKDWSLARQIWDQLMRLRPELVADSYLAHVAAVLRDEEAMVYPHSHSIH